MTTVWLAQAGNHRPCAFATAKAARYWAMRRYRIIEPDDFDDELDDLRARCKGTYFGVSDYSVEIWGTNLTGAES